VKQDKPADLTWAETVIRLAERFHVLPSAILAEDAGLLRMLNLLDPDCGKAEE
jgi:hypothetical protein